MTDLNCEITDAVATVTLNRPQARNALSAALRQELRATIARLDDDDTVRAIVLTGADPAFCAGVDLRELSAPGPHPAVGPLAEPFITSRTPLIGAINGAAYTGGLELALACHLLVASERASFADTHARIGFTPGWGLTVLLTEAIGSRRAREMTLSCQPIDAQTALQWGLVNRVVPHEDLLRETAALASAIAANDAAAVRRLTGLFNDQAAARDLTSWQLEAKAFMGSELPTDRQ
ncbi:unannotated protein [freshwater metagenome]|uniref:Unannotated protein n=1 Tax=freshwater metagenome TaxID=449393 RepID=A0A6J7BYE5_9ZZZZ|nr:enoyl-CoA hydratase [Actinomycetota bacterium]MSW36831.1 enoyl-CoA hydratase [Actinomycetota bacterium]MSX38605.1 enoyl-CoA hydratase [Actinomycetota bacterium]